MTNSIVQSERSFPERMQEHDFGSYDFRNDSMTADEAYRLGKSLSEFYEGDKRIIVGNDHRKHSEPVKNGLIDGFVDSGVEVEYIGLAPTDLVAHYVAGNREAEGGVAVTASHMPPDHRGLKPLNHEGRIFDEEELDQVLEDYREISETRQTYREWRSDSAADIYENYISAGLDRYNQLFDEDLSGLEVAVDPGNGVGALTLPRLLTEAGVDEDDLYLVNHRLDPDFSGRGPDPTESDLEDLKDVISREGADLGIALDGDADRAVFVNEEAERVLGDESLAILAEKYLRENPGDKDLNKAVCSANTSQLVEEWVANDRAEGVINYQPVGAVFTAKEALRGEDNVFGGQPNGHFLDPDFVAYDSGTLIGTVMAGVVNEADGTMSQVQERLPSYDVERVNWEVDDQELAMKALKQQFDSRDVQGVQRADVVQENILQVTGANDKIIFRPSGNEPVIRITMERRSQSEVLDQLTQNIGEVMDKES